MTSLSSTLKLIVASLCVIHALGLTLQSGECSHERGKMCLVIEGVERVDKTDERGLTSILQNTNKWEQPCQQPIFIQREGDKQWLGYSFVKSSGVFVQTEQFQGIGTTSGHDQKTIDDVRNAILAKRVAVKPSVYSFDAVVIQAVNSNKPKDNPEFRKIGYWPLDHAWKNDIELELSPLRLSYESPDAPSKDAFWKLSHCVLFNLGKTAADVKEDRHHIIYFMGYGTTHWSPSAKKAKLIHPVARSQMLLTNGKVFYHSDPGGRLTGYTLDTGAEGSPMIRMRAMAKRGQDWVMSRAKFAYDLLSRHWMFPDETGTLYGVTGIRIHGDERAAAYARDRWFDDTYGSKKKKAKAVNEMYGDDQYAQANDENDDLYDDYYWANLYQEVVQKWSRLLKGYQQ